jgi:hypothetical protein
MIMNESTNEQSQANSDVPTQKLDALLLADIPESDGQQPSHTDIPEPESDGPCDDIPTRKLDALSITESGELPKPPERTQSSVSGIILLVTIVLLTGVLLSIFYPLLTQLLATQRQAQTQRAHIAAKPRPTLTPTPTPFDPNVGAVLPTHRVVAFYAIPNAPSTGPAYELTSSMLKALQKQADAYQQLDPAHPVQPGIDLVVSIPDSFPGPEKNYSHHLDAATIQSYIDYCQQNGLILFLDLDFGLASIKSEVNFFLPYLERYSFVQMAIDPEWMFPRHDGIPGVNLSNVRASDLNPIIETLAELPMKYHVPRKMLLIHQYRSDGDGLKNPYDAGLAEIADKRNLLNDPRVDVVIHIDSVGGYIGDQADKTWQYNTWVGQDMQKYHNFRYGGFKLFYHLEKKTLMHPQQVLALNPPPMVVTYGN